MDEPRFKRDGVYYAMTGGCTCFGLGGAGVVVNTALAPLGPWTTRSTSLDPGCPGDWITDHRCGIYQGEPSHGP